MKIGGIILLVFGVLNLIIALIATGSEASSDIVGQKLGQAAMLSVIAIFLLHMAKKKKIKKKEKDEWNKQ